MLNAANLVTNLKIPHQTRSKPEMHPTLQQFLNCATPDEFADLTNDEDGRPIKDLLALPNLHFIHPALFVSCMEQPSLPAEELAISVIKEAANGCPTDFEEEEGETEDEDNTGQQPSMIHIDQLLSFLWAISRGCSSHTQLADMPDDPEIDQICKTLREDAVEFLRNSNDRTAALKTATRTSTSLLSTG